MRSRSQLTLIGALIFSACNPFQTLVPALQPNDIEIQTAPPPRVSYVTGTPLTAATATLLPARLAPSETQIIPSALATATRTLTPAMPVLPTVVEQFFQAQAIVAQETSAPPAAGGVRSARLTEIIEVVEARADQC